MTVKTPSPGAVEIFDATASKVVTFAARGAGVNASAMVIAQLPRTVAITRSAFNGLWMVAVRLDYVREE